MGRVNFVDCVTCRFPVLSSSCFVRGEQCRPLGAFSQVYRWMCGQLDKQFVLCQWRTVSQFGSRPGFLFFQVHAVSVGNSAAD